MENIYKTQNIIIHSYTDRLDVMKLAKKCESMQDDFCKTFGIVDNELNNKVNVYVFGDKEERLAFSKQNPNEISHYCQERNTDYLWISSDVVARTIYRLIKQNFLDNGECCEPIADAITSLYYDKVNYINSNYFEHWYIRSIHNKAIADKVASKQDVVIVAYLIDTQKLEILKYNEVEFAKSRDELYALAKEYFDKKYKVDDIPTQYKDIKSVDDLLRFMDKYVITGYMGKDKSIHVDSYTNIHENCQLETIEEMLNNHVGTCAEQAKFIKYWLDENVIENKVFYCASYNGVLNKDDNYDNLDCNHFLVFAKMKDKWVHIEHSNMLAEGVYSFDSLNQALSNQVLPFFLWRKFELYEVDEIPSGLSFVEMYDYMSKCPKVEWHGETADEFCVDYMQEKNEELNKRI